MFSSRELGFMITRKHINFKCLCSTKSLEKELIEIDCCSIESYNLIYNKNIIALFLETEEVRLK